ncbi:hypothetical protein MYXA107069_18350 [Myxococcus xanthus]|nr:hypothetical protein MyxoNM_08610 [Myxococcus xanthus]SDY20758.1 hypothetical protein SAMN05444383_12420 [Myxococcus xanthus]
MCCLVPGGTVMNRHGMMRSVGMAQALVASLCGCGAEDRPGLLRQEDMAPYSMAVKQGGTVW